MCIMSPGVRGVFIKGTDIFNLNRVEADLYTSWKEGKLVLRNEPMDEVVKKMNRWYNVNIIIRDSRLESFSYRATFVDEKLDEGIEDISSNFSHCLQRTGKGQES